MRIGIDLGGTKIEIIVLDEQGQEIYRQRLGTPHNDYTATLHVIAQLIERAENVLGRQGSVGVGTPGALSRRTGLLKNSNSVCLNGKPIIQDLESLLHRPIRLSNDANCFALSEAIDGNAAGAQVVFGVIIGTGIGGGIIVSGRPLEGVNGIAGEWGHNPMPWPSQDELPGPACYCGKYGCIEAFLSGPALAREYQLVTGRYLAAEQIVACATASDASAQNVLAHYERRLAKALAQVINILDPDVIVLGGGLSNIRSLYANVPRIWSEYVFSDQVDTKLVAPKYGDSSGVRGAAWLWE